MSQVTTLILAVIAVIATNQVSGLKVSVYYESLCPDSIAFITRQLYPTYQQLQFDVELVPYGKAEHRTNPWSIRCQHGANECLGNAVQACMLERLSNNKDQVEFVNCVMSTSYPPLYGSQCGNQLGLSYEGVSACSTGEEGQKLLARNGDTTHSLQPALTFVPTVIINDNFTQANQDLALRDLRQAICTADPTVVGCSRKRYY